MFPLISELSQGPGRHVHRNVVRLAVVGGWLSVAILSIAALVTGERQMWLQVIGPVVASLVFTWQAVFRHYNAVITLAAGVGTVVVIHALVGTDETDLAAGISVVAMGVIASMFIRGSMLMFLAGGSAFMLATPMVWERSVSAGAAAGVTMTIVFVIGSAAFLSLRRSLLEVESDYQRLFDEAPVGLMEQEWAAAIKHVDAVLTERGLTVADLPDLVTDREFVQGVVARVEVLRVNDRMGELSGVDPQTMLGPVPRSRVNASSAESWGREILAVLNEDTRFRSEYRTKTWDGSSDMWVAIESIKMGRGRDSFRLVLSVQDVSESRRRAESLADLVRTKDEFIASVSHELRTPLTAVVGLTAELVAAEDLDPTFQRELLQVVARQSEEIAFLVEDLLVGARAELGTIAVATETVDIVEQAERAAATVGEDDLAVTGDTSAYVLADPVRVRQILRNLLVNAHRYGGPMRRMEVFQAGDEVVVEIRDDGQPLPAADRVTIFQPYGRAHDRPGVTESVGLGLSVSRQLARLMDGDLVYDHDGETVFRLTLPAAPRSAAAIDQAVERVEA